MHDHHIVYRNAVFLGDYLRKGRLFSLAMRGRARVDHYRATLLDTHTRTLIQTNRRRSLGAKAADLDVGGYTNAHQFAITRCTPSSLFSTQALVIGNLKRLIQCTLVVASVVDGSGSRFVRELIWLNKVEPSYLSRIFPQFTGHQVYGSLSNKCGFRTARTTIRICWSLIGEDN